MKTQPNIKEKVFLTRVNMFFGHAVGNIVGGLVGGVMIGTVLYSTGISLVIIATWYAGLIIACGMTYFVEHMFSKSKLDSSNARSWLMRRLSAGALIGLSYGVTPLLLESGVFFEAKLLLFIMLSILVSVASIGYSIMPAYYLTLNVIVLWPITISFFETLDIQHIIMILTSVIWQILVLSKAIVVSRSMVEALYTNERLQHEVEERMKAEEALRESEERYKDLASTDVLTGLANRRSGILFLEKEISMAKRKGITVTVCFIDVDGLKTINDIQGHDVGDDLIKSSGIVLTNILRESDLVCRFGGDEFLVIFPDCNIKQADELWNRIAAELQRFNSTSDKSFQISFSHGFAEFSPSNNLSTDELISMADSEMYKEKKQKRR
jgi:diguanylate cyclase (GGDEF)-like protein